jgi:hypothetical protein
VFFSFLPLNATLTPISPSYFHFLPLVIILLLSLIFFLLCPIRTVWDSNNIRDYFLLTSRRSACLSLASVRKVSLYYYVQLCNANWAVNYNFSSYLLELLSAVLPPETRTRLDHDGSLLCSGEYTWFVRRHLWDVTGYLVRQERRMAPTSIQMIPWMFHRLTTLYCLIKVLTTWTM